MKFMLSVRSQTIALLILNAICTTHASAQQIKAGDLVLDHAWARATPAGANVGGGFLTIENKGATPDKLIGGSSRAAGKVEVHETAMNNGVATMRPVKEGVSIPLGQTVTLAPGGLSPHVDGPERSVKKVRQAGGHAGVRKSWRG
jgi:periplasmic copper chaperone A